MVAVHFLKPINRYSYVFDSFISQSDDLTSSLYTIELDKQFVAKRAICTFPAVAILLQ